MTPTSLSSDSRFKHLVRRHKLTSSRVANVACFNISESSSLYVSTRSIVELKEKSYLSINIVPYFYNFSYNIPWLIGTYKGAWAIWDARSSSCKSSNSGIMGISTRNKWQQSVCEYELLKTMEVENGMYIWNVSVSLH